VAVWQRIGKAIEIGEPHLLHLDAKAVLQPLDGEMAVAPFAANVAVVCRLPAQHHRHFTIAEELVADYDWVESIEDLPVACQVLLRGDRIKPWPGSSSRSH